MTISVSDNTPRVSYSVSEGATQTSFTVSFEFFADADLNVYVDGTKKTLTTHYSVTGGDGSTGSISMSVTGASGGSTVVITRGIALERTTDFPVSGAFAVGTLNTELDRFVAIQADLNDTITRSIRLQDDDSAVSMELPLKSARLGTVLGFNASTGAVEAGPTIANVNSLSAITANINTVAGISSNVTTVAGVASNVTTVAGVASNVTTVAGIASNVTSVANDATDIGAVAGKATEIGRLGTSASVTSLGLLGTSDAVSDMNTLAAISSNITSVANVSSNVTTVAGISSNVTTVAGKASLITSDFAADMALIDSTFVTKMNLVTSDFVSDMAAVTSDFISDLNTLATSDIVSDLNTLATSDIVSDLNTLATTAIVEDLNLLATSSVIADMATLAGSGASPNITSVTASGAITAGSFVIGSADINENDLEAIDGITAGTVAASKAAVVDTNKDITGFRNITLTGELDAGSLDVSGDADIDGTLEADAITVNGTTLTEFIQDTVGGMVTGNTETGIAVSYEDGDGTLDFVVSSSPTAADDIGTGDAAVTIATSTGNITFDAQGSDTDIIFKGTDGSSDTTFLTLDGSEAGAATFNSGITLGSSLAANGAPFTISNTSNGNNIDIKTTSGGSLVHAVKIHSGGVFEAKQGAVFNEDSNDVDFRVEGNSDANLLFVDASTDRVGIGKSGPSELLDVDGTLNTTNLKIGGAQGSNGQVLTSTGSGVGWADAGGGGAFTLVGATVTTSEVANIKLFGSNAFTTTYDEYFIIFQTQAHSSNNDYYEFRFTDDSGNEESSANYAYRMGTDTGANNNKYNQDAFFADSGLLMYCVNENRNSSALYMYVSYPKSTTFWSKIVGWHSPSDSSKALAFAGAYRNDSATFGGISFNVRGSNNFRTSSSLKIYGIAKS